MAKAKKKSTTKKKNTSNYKGPPPNPNMPALKVVIINAIQAGASRKTAYQIAGISKGTFYNWQDADPVFKSSVNIALATVNGNMEETLKKCALLAEQDPKYLKALIYYLDKRMNYEHMNDVVDDSVSDNKVKTIEVVLHDHSNTTTK